jgi:hypothetical protein
MDQASLEIASENLARGRKRMRELAQEAQAERESLAAELLAGLGRTPSTVDRIAATNLAALHVRAKRLEAAGRDAVEIRRQITQMIRATGLRPAPVETAKPADPMAAIKAYGEQSGEAAS